MPTRPTQTTPSPIGGSLLRALVSGLVLCLPLLSSAGYSNIVINEIMYHPPGKDSEGEYIEIYNQGVENATLDGWRLGNAVEYTFPAGTTIHSGSYLVIAGDPATILSRYGLTTVLGPWNGQLKNGGERVRLYNQFDGPVDEVRYNDSPPWPTGGDGDGRSIELTDPNKNNDVGRFWAPSPDLMGSPGKTNRAQSGASSSPIPAGSQWRYFKGTQEPSAPPTAWTQIGFDDSSWEVGPAGFGYDDGDDATHLDDMLGNYLSVYIRHSFSITNSSSYEKLLLKIRYDDGFVAYLNGSEVTRSLGMVGQGSPPPHDATSSEDHEAEFLETFDLTAHLDKLQDGTNVFCLQGHNKGFESSDFSLAPHLSAEVRSETFECPVVINEFLAKSSGEDWIELYNMGEEDWDLNGYYLTDTHTNPTRTRIDNSLMTDTILGAGEFVRFDQTQLGFGLAGDGEQIYLVAPDGRTWCDGYDFSNQPSQDVSEGRYPDGNDTWYQMRTPTPENANSLSLENRIIISEIMYHPVNDSTDEFIEIYNAGSLAMGLNRWRLEDAVDFVFPSTATIEAGSFVVIAGNPAAVANRYGTYPVLGPWSGRLSNQSEEIELRDPLGNKVDSVRYQDEGLWPEKADGEGPSLELVNTTVDNSLPGMWQASSGSGTPGKSNSRIVTDPSSSIDEVKHSPAVPLTGEEVTITARVAAGNLLSVTLTYSPEGDETWSYKQMLDDGLHGDIAAGDGVFGATIEPQNAGTLVRFHIRALATGGNVIFPATAPLLNCLYQVEEGPISSNLDIYRVLMTQAAHEELGQMDPLARERVDCTFIYGNEIFYNCEFRYRGGDITVAKRSYKVFLPKGYKWRGHDRFNLNAERKDFPFLKDWIGYELLDRLGLPASDMRYCHLRLRGQFAGVYYYGEQQDRDFLDEYLGGDDTGNMYKANCCFTVLDWRGSDPGEYPDYEKKTNEEENNWSDFIGLLNAFNNTPEASYEADLGSRIDRRNWGKSMAFLAVMAQWDSFWNVQGNNYRLYHKPSDDTFILLLYDFDTVLESEELVEVGFAASVHEHINRYLTYPAFARYYQHGIWLAVNSTSGFFRVETVRGHMNIAHSAVAPDLPLDPDSSQRLHLFMEGPATLLDYISRRNTYLRSILPTAMLAITTNGGNDFSTQNTAITLEGTAPLSAAYLSIHGSTEEPKWTTTTTWQKTVQLTSHTTEVEVISYDEEMKELERVSINISAEGIPTLTPTPTETITETPSPTPSTTPLSTSTPSPTVSVVYDLDGQNGVRGSDLLLLIEAIRSASSTIDFTGDSVCNKDDLMDFSLRWQASTKGMR